MGDPALTRSAGGANRPLPFWVDELPYIVMLLLTLGGVMYASVSPRATFDYWQVLVPLFAIICIVAGWRRAVGKIDRWRLVWTQALHWGAIFVAMRLLFMPNVHQMLNSDAVGLAAMAIMSLGTFLAGVHATSWRVTVVGLFLAAAVPIAALLEEAVLVLLAGGLVLTGVFAAVVWWKKRKVESEMASISGA